MYALRRDPEMLTFDFVGMATTVDTIKPKAKIIFIIVRYHSQNNMMFFLCTKESLIIVIVVFTLA